MGLGIESGVSPHKVSKELSSKEIPRKSSCTTVNGDWEVAF